MGGRLLRGVVVALGVAFGALGDARAQEALLDDQLQRASNVPFREGILLDRSFKYRDDSFITELSYRPRYPLRVLARLASTGYALTVGSTSTTDFLLDQEARIRLPFASWAIGEFQFLQNEDWDERYLHATGEVSVLIPGTGPDVAAPLSLLANTPPPWGIFAGASVELNAFKEFVDTGVQVGYRNRVIGGRLDLLFPAAFYNQKNRTGGKIDGAPLAFLGQIEAALGDDGPFLDAWFGHQPRVSGTFPAEKLLRGSFEKTRGGVEVIVPWDRTFVIDVDALGELTSKRRDFDETPARADAFEREAGQVWVDANLYLGEGRNVKETGPVEPLRREPSDDALARPWGARPPEERGGIGPELSSRDAVVPRDVLARTTPANWATTDVLELGLFAQYLRESTTPRGGPGPFPPTTRTLRRELYGYSGYFLTLPDVVQGLAFHPSAYVGYVFFEERNRGGGLADKNDEGVLAKLDLALEYRFRDKVVLVGNVTFRLDQPQFGGGNVQLVFRF